MNYIEATIGDINDLGFQSLIQELCLCAGFNCSEMSTKTFRFLLMAIGREGRKLTASRAPITNILSLRVGELPQKSIVRCVCKELGDLTGTPVDAFEKNAVLSVIRRQHSIFCPKPKRRSTTRARERYDFMTDLIKRRRQNGSL